jgi:hypothetical protein
MELAGGRHACGKSIRSVVIELCTQELLQVTKMSTPGGRMTSTVNAMPRRAPAASAQACYDENPFRGAKR